MITGQPTTYKSEAGQFFRNLLCQPDRLHFPHRTANSLWDMIAASDDPEAAAFRFATTQLIDRVRQGDEAVIERMMDTYFSDWLTPSLLIEGLNELYNREEIGLRDMRELRANVLKWTTGSGQWRW